MLEASHATSVQIYAADKRLIVDSLLSTLAHGLHQKYLFDLSQGRHMLVIVFAGGVIQQLVAVKDGGTLHLFLRTAVIDLGGLLTKTFPLPICDPFQVGYLQRAR